MEGSGRGVREGSRNLPDVMCKGSREGGQRPRAIAIGNEFAAKDDSGFLGDFSQVLGIHPLLGKDRPHFASTDRIHRRSKVL